MSQEEQSSQQIGDNINTLDGTKAKSQVLIAEGDFQSYYLYGDAINLVDGARGGNDLIIGMSIANNLDNKVGNLIYGDADILQNSIGGNDQIYGGNSVFENALYGDAFSMEASKGGNDYLKGGDNTWFNLIYGDAALMSGTFNSEGLMIASLGGNDILVGGKNSSNELCGDAQRIKYAICGNDLLISGDVESEFLNIENYLIGDAATADFGGGIGGNDRLISGTGRDSMWGDFVSIRSVATFGSDIFVFKINNGADAIYDFHHSEDKIELSGIAYVDDFTDLQISESDGSSLITLGIDDTIMVIGVTGLQAQDFIFS